MAQLQHRTRSRYERKKSCEDGGTGRRCECCELVSDLGKDPQTYKGPSQTAELVR